MSNNLQEIIEYRKKEKISKVEYKRMFRLGESMKAFYESAKSFLQDAQELFAKKRYRTCILCCQLGLEEMGMALRISDLMLLTNQDDIFNKDFSEIVKARINHKFKIGGITRFRFRYSYQREELSRLTAHYLHRNRIEKTYVDYDKEKRFFVSPPPVTRIEAYNDLKIAKHYILDCGLAVPAIIRNIKDTINLFGVKKKMSKSN